MDSKSRRVHEKHRRKPLGPLPGLLAADSTGAAVALENNRVIVFRNTRVKNTHLLTLGPNVTALAEEIAFETASLKYTLPLAYVISVGGDLFEEELLSQLDDLIATSVKIWTDGKTY